MVRVVFGGRTIAECDSAFRVLETASPPVYYLPPDTVGAEHLEASPLESFCEWKGLARYHHLRVGDDWVENAAWSYPEPEPDYSMLKDYLAFYPGRVGAGVVARSASGKASVSGCYLGNERVRPQAGPFYGGWVTDEIKGPFKGSPGSEGW